VAEVLDESLPELVVERAGGLEPVAEFERTGEGLRARFALAAPVTDWTPRLRGGGALVLSSIRLRVQP
jgi:hypothetical protein